MRNLIQEFNIDQFKKEILLAFVYDDQTIVFGPEFVAQVLVLEYGDDYDFYVYVSRSYYDEKHDYYSGDNYYGWPASVPDRNNEDFLIKTLIKIKKFAPVDRLVCKILSMKPCLCHKCKGKGFIDWIEEIIKTDQYNNFKRDIPITLSILSESYYEINFFNNITVLYRARNIQGEYLRECKICPECHGVGYDHSAVQSFVSYPISEDFFRVIKSYDGFTKKIPPPQHSHDLLTDPSSYRIFLI